MAHAICPNCGSGLEVIHGFSGPSLSCPQCAWNSSVKKRTVSDVPPSLPEFLKHLPTREEIRDAFPGLLNSPRPRPLQWDWSIGVISVFIVLFAWLLIWDLTHSQYYFASTGRIPFLEQG